MPCLIDVPRVLLDLEVYQVSPVPKVTPENWVPLVLKANGDRLESMEFLENQVNG